MWSPPTRNGNGTFSKPPDNGRIATIVMTKSAPLLWLAIHESWLPEAAMQADAYDF